MHFANVNFLSILTAAVAAWIFGGIYYTALSKPWLAAQGKTMDQCKAEQAGKSRLAMTMPFILAFVGALIMAWVLYGILRHLGTFTLRAGMISGAFCWFGFVLTTMTVNNAFGGKKLMLTVIDGVHWLIGLLIIGGIVGAWGG